MTEFAGKILVVDDEPSICESIEIILTRAGFMVKSAFSGEEAVEMSHGEVFDLILMDLVMPGIDGADTCAEIRKHRPDTKIMAISGSPAGVRVDKFVSSGGIEIFLFKPFGKAELLENVRKALG